MSTQVLEVQTAVAQSGECSVNFFSTILLVIVLDVLMSLTMLRYLSLSVIVKSFKLFLFQTLLVFYNFSNLEL